jgi:alpha-1,2-mannosyltransferase
MNIGIIHGFVGGGGGTEKTLHGILESLEQTEHNVTLYTFSKPKISFKKIKIKSSLPFSIPSFGLYQRTMESKLISKAKNEDILIQASGGLGIPSNPEQKIMVYAHADFSSELDNPLTKYKGIWSLYYKSYYNMMKKFVNRISDSNIILISNSKFVHDSIKSRYDKDSKIIYPPVNLQEFNSQEKKNQIITIGRFSKEKNLEFGINIMSNLDSKYYVIGNTKTKSNILYYEKLESNIKKQKLELKVKLLKNLDRNELVNYLNASKVYLHCSNETFGISVVESIAAGCIPIVPNTSAHKETVPIDELRFKENDENDVINKLNSAINGDYDSVQPSLRENIEKFSQEKFQKSLLELIKENS